MITITKMLYILSFASGVGYGNGSNVTRANGKRLALDVSIYYMCSLRLSALQITAEFFQRGWYLLIATARGEKEEIEHERTGAFPLWKCFQRGKGGS